MLGIVSILNIEMSSIWKDRGKPIHWFLFVTQSIEFKQVKLRRNM
jgi:hypothetical protein